MELNQLMVTPVSHVKKGLIRSTWKDGRTKANLSGDVSYCKCIYNGESI